MACDRIATICPTDEGLDVAEASEVCRHTRLQIDRHRRGVSRVAQRIRRRTTLQILKAVKGRSVQRPGIRTAHVERVRHSRPPREQVAASPTVDRHASARIQRIKTTQIKRVCQASNCRVRIDRQGGRRIAEQHRRAAARTGQTRQTIHQRSVVCDGDTVRRVSKREGAAA